MKKSTSYNGAKDENLPIDINTWVQINKPKEDLILTKSFFNHINFICDRLYSILVPNFEERKNNMPIVISTFRSRSIKLPVMEINLEKYGIEIVLCYNFYEWKISIKSKWPINIESNTLFNFKEELLPIYCEGIPKSKIYGSYAKNNSKFTAEILSHYDLYILFYIIKKNINKNMKI